MSEEAQLSALQQASRDELIRLWQAHVQTAVPRGLSRPLLVRAIAWALQAKQSGGHRASTRERLSNLANGRLSSPMAPGTKLIREWQGKVYEVTVLEHGFAYGGRTYSSLTAIARAITGTKWSGPRFFGLTRK